ncbi:MAG: hypothetical protein ACLFO2_01440 [Candidatus Woesearchaeota archaeon]
MGRRVVTAFLLFLGREWGFLRVILGRGVDAPLRRLVIRRRRILIEGGLLVRNSRFLRGIILRRGRLLLKGRLRLSKRCRRGFGFRR